MVSDSDIIYYVAGFSSVLLLTCSCCGLYWRYSNAVKQRHHRMQQMETLAQNTNLPRVLQRDTLKNKMKELFLKQSTEENDPEKALQLTHISYIDCQTRCPICLMDYDTDVSQVFTGFIKNCGHYFHFECVWDWLERKQNCPICREACKLAETDIQGLSLKQVLEASHSHTSMEGDPKDFEVSTHEVELGSNLPTSNSARDILGCNLSSN